MNIPSLPTDNLYKFLALSGLFIVIFSITITEIRLAELESQSENYITQSGELYFEIQSLKSDLEKIVENGNSESKKLNDQIRIKEYKLSRIKEIIEKKTIRTKSVFRWSIFGVILGVLISVFGFTLWYNRVQRFLDDKLKREATE